jgi:uncharacterized protein
MSVAFPYAWWTITTILMLVGLLGTVVPMLPGTTVIWAAAVLHYVLMWWKPGVTLEAADWIMLGGLTLLTAISYVIDFFSGLIGAKWFGATRWGAIGGLIGGIVGLFFPPVGFFVGPLAGVLIGELLGGKELLPAGKSTWGTFLGTTAGIIARVILAIAMIAWFLAVALPPVKLW